MDLSELLELFCQGKITSDKLNEELIKKDAYSGKEVCNLLQAVVKRIDGLEAKIGIVGEINKENLEKIKDELRQKIGTVGKIQVPSDKDNDLLNSKANALEKIGKLYEAGDLYLLCDCYQIKVQCNHCLFLSFCSRNAKNLNARILDKYELLLKIINEQKSPKSVTHYLIDFYSQRAELYEQFGDKESAEKDRKELQKILEKM